MKNIPVIIIVIFLSLLFVPNLRATELTRGEKDTIFIGALDIQPSAIESAKAKGFLLELKMVSNSFDSQLTNALSSTRVFQLVERKRKGDIELEQDFSSVAIDPDDKNAAKAGKMAGARFAFFPQIDVFEDRVDTDDHRAINRTSLHRKIFLSATVRVVDTTTGKNLPDAPSVQLTKEEILTNVKAEQAIGSDRIIVELAKEVAQKLSFELISIIRPAKILTITGKQIHINRGTEAGFNKGDSVEIYAVQDVKDEDSGEVFQNEIPVGRAVIARTDKRQSFAMIAGENLGINSGCIVKPLKTHNNHDERGENQNRDLTPGSSEAPSKW